MKKFGKLIQTHQKSLRVEMAKLDFEEFYYVIFLSGYIGVPKVVKC